jgi:hypothetical protein
LKYLFYTSSVLNRGACWTGDEGVICVRVAEMIRMGVFDPLSDLQPALLTDTTYCLSPLILHHTDCYIWQDAPVGREKPDIFLAALIRVEATYSLNVAFCSSVKVSLDGSRSMGCTWWGREKKGERESGEGEEGSVGEKDEGKEVGRGEGGWEV